MVNEQHLLQMSYEKNNEIASLISQKKDLENQKRNYKGKIEEQVKEITMLRDDLMGSQRKLNNIQKNLENMEETRKEIMEIIERDCLNEVVKKELLSKIETCVIMNEVKHNGGYQ